MYGNLSGLIEVQGKSDHLRQVGHLSEELARVYAAEIIVGLQQCHDSSIMHRDLKPENIMIGEDLHLKIVSKLRVIFRSTSEMPNCLLRTNSQSQRWLTMPILKGLPNR
jgi:serine/threonine protein kinase